MQSEVGGLRIEDLQQNEFFISAAIQATTAALGTHHEEKRTALRNTVLNIALGRCPEEDEAQMFLRYKEELQPWHIRILTCLSDTEAMNEY